jgi:hypothetical protein
LYGCGFARRIPRISVILTKSASDLVPIFFMMCPRCIFTVISAMPISAAICLFMSPAATKDSTSRSRGAGSRKEPVRSRRSSHLWSLPIAFDRHRYGIQHFLLAEGLAQEIDRSSLHGHDRHRDIAMAGHENDWNVNVRLGELSLKVQAAQSRQPDVEDQTASNIWKRAPQQFGGRTEHLHPQDYRLEEIGERSTHGFVVVDHEDDRLLAAREVVRRCWAPHSPGAKEG